MKHMRITWSLILACFLVGGCAIPEHYGRIVRSGEIGRQIEAANVLPGHTYYYTGPEAQPDAIIAVDNTYTLKSKYWIKVNTETVAEQLKDWNRFIDNDTRYMETYEGFVILTPDGQRAGLWYSNYNHTVVQFPDSSTLILYTPDTSRGPIKPSRSHFRRY